MFLLSPPVEGTTKTSSRKQQVSPPPFLSLATNCFKSTQVGDSCKDACCRKLNFRLRDEKSRLRCFLTPKPQAMTDTWPSASVNQDRTVKAALRLRQIRLHVLSVGADTEPTCGTNRCRHNCVGTRRAIRPFFFII